MQLFTLQSKKEQLAEAIKSQIVRGKVIAGAKLSSVRDLASSFNVSTKIVVGALDLLEREHLIKREAGRGIFVRSCSVHTNIEVCILSWNVNVLADQYFNDLVRILHPPYLHPGFNFTVRTVPFSKEATTNHFAHELQKFDKMYNAKCLLIHAPNLSSDKIKACLKVNTSIIFIGDFSHGFNLDIPYNQITGDNFKQGENSVRELLKKRELKEFILYIPSIEHYFCRRFYEGALGVSKELNVKMHLIATPKGFSSLDNSRKKEIFSAITKQGGIEDVLNIPAINGGLPNAFLKEQITAGTASREIYYHKNSNNYLHRFYDTIFDEIKRTIESPNNIKKIILEEKPEDFSLSKIK